MKITLIREWMGRHKGNVLNLNEHMANRLIRWGTARSYDPARNGEGEPVQEKKQIKTAPFDKSMRGRKKNIKSLVT